MCPLGISLCTLRNIHTASRGRVQSARRNAPTHRLHRCQIVRWGPPGGSSQSVSADPDPDGALQSHSAPLPAGAAGGLRPLPLDRCMGWVGRPGG